MPSYVITGVSRGIGVSGKLDDRGVIFLLTRLCLRQYEFLRQYSSEPDNVVIGVVRDKKTTDAKIAEDAELAKRSNVHILEADLTDYKAMQVSSLLKPDALVARGARRSLTDLGRVLSRPLRLLRAEVWTTSLAMLPC